MNTNTLKENRDHGTPLLPVASYIETISTKKYEVSLHWHSEMEFVYIAEGKATFTIDLQEYTVEKGDFLIVPPNALHSFIPLPDYKCTCHTLVADLRFVESIILDTVTSDYVIPILNGNATYTQDPIRSLASYETIIDCHSKIIKLQVEKPQHYPLKLKTYLLELLVILFDAHIISNKPAQRTANDKIEALRKVMKYIYENRTGNISIEKLASISGYNNDYFIRFFKKHLHQTPVHYIRSYRLNYAATLLKSQDLNITEVAHESGFNNVSYLIKLFKIQYGMTPKEYQKLVV